MEDPDEPEEDPDDDELVVDGVAPVLVPLAFPVLLLLLLFFVLLVFGVLFVLDVDLLE